MKAERYDQFLDRVSRRAGFTRRSDAERAVEATMTALGEAVGRFTAYRVADGVPLEVGTPMRTAPSQPIPDRDGFYARVLHHAGLSDPQTGFAREHANAVCATLTETLDPDSLHLLSKDLPPDVAALLHRPDTEGRSGNDAERRGGRRGVVVGVSGDQAVARPASPRSSQGQTLASGRPAHTNSPAVMPDAAPPGSLLQGENPRRGTKVASSPGPSAERLGRTPGDAEPPLAEQAEPPLTHFEND